MVFNQFSEKFILKFFSETFKDISNQSWYTTLFHYIIDSKFRTTKRLDSFLKEQIDNPHIDLVTVAKDLRFSCLKPDGMVDSDKLIIEILKYVKTRVRYTTDQSNFGYTEKWANAYMVWKTKEDDCDGQNSLIYVLARLAGISDLVLWSCIGDTKDGGHYWNIYFSATMGAWYSIDATYYPDFTDIKHRITFNFNKNKYQGIWYCFNEQFILKQG